MNIEYEVSTLAHASGLDGLVTIITFHDEPPHPETGKVSVNVRGMKAGGVLIENPVAILEHFITHYWGMTVADYDLDGMVTEATQSDAWGYKAAGVIRQETTPPAGGDRAGPLVLRSGVLQRGGTVRLPLPGGLTMILLTDDLEILKNSFAVTANVERLATRVTGQYWQSRENTFAHEVVALDKQDQATLSALQKKKRTPKTEIKILRLQTTIQANRRVFLATLARFRSMCEQHQSLLDRVGVAGFSVAMLEQEELSHWVRRLMTQTLNEWIQYTRMSLGQAEAWRKMGVDPLFVSLHVNQFMTAQVMGTVQTAPDLKLRNAFEDGMASLLAPVIKDHLDRQGQRLGG